jgi:LysR family transcriptional regulator, low CO2-responsive transcriptional regulator
MNYTLHQLQIFLKITQTKSITKAAAELHLTQPAVSIQLKNFQNQFDIALTEVIGRKLFVTEFGKEIAIAAEKILNEVNAINYKTHTHRGLTAGKLKISVVSTGKYVMPYFLTGFMSENKGVELLMDVTNKSRVLESLEKNEVDFALVSVIPAGMQVNTLKLMDNKLYLVSDSSRQITNKHHKWSIFESLPLIFREEGSGTRHIMEKFFDSNQLPVSKKMELTSNEAVKQAVIAGLGCSVMPLIGIKNELKNKELQIIPVKGFPLKSDWQLVWLKSKKLAPVAEAFLKFLSQNRKTIISDRFSWAEKY